MLTDIADLQAGAGASWTTTEKQLFNQMYQHYIQTILIYSIEIPHTVIHLDQSSFQTTLHKIY